MVATGYHVERAILLSFSSVLVLFCSYVTYTIYTRGKKTANYFRLLMSCFFTAAAVILLINNIDFECVFGLYNPYLAAAFSHNSATCLFGGVIQLTIVHLELVYKFMRLRPPSAIRRIGIACGLFHWIAGNLCVLLMVVVKNEIFLGLYFVVYIVSIISLVILVNTAVCRVINIVKQHIKDSNLSSSIELKKVMHQSRTFQLGETVVCAAAIIVLIFRAIASLHPVTLTDGLSNPLFMDPNKYSFGCALIVAQLLGDYLANFWMLAGERHQAKSGGSQLSSGGKSGKNLVMSSNNRGSSKMIDLNPAPNHSHKPSSNGSFIGNQPGGGSVGNQFITLNLNVNDTAISLPARDSTLPARDSTLPARDPTCLSETSPPNHTSGAVDESSST